MKQTSFENFDSTLVPGSIKTAMKDIGASSRDLWQVKVSDLRAIPNFNVRIKDAEYKAHVRALADSMKSEGFYQDKPLSGFVAKDGDAQIIYYTDGHCRYEAVQLAISEGAEIERVPVVVSPQGTSMEDLTVSLVRSNSGKPLAPYELAVVCKRLSRFGWEQDEISARLGLSGKYVEGLLLLIGSSREVREMVITCQVAASMAIEALRKYGVQAYEKLQQGLNAAKAAGGDRVTRKYLPETILKKQVTKAAPVLFDTMRAVTTDPGYRHISKDLRDKLDALLSQLNSINTAQAGDTSSHSTE
jgi:ParB-like chromosome segregation protein Spo0J